jgi:hypothetical protein
MPTIFFFKKENLKINFVPNENRIFYNETKDLKHSIVDVGSIHINIYS